jgi:hypothetical protein
LGFIRTMLALSFKIMENKFAYCYRNRRRNNLETFPRLIVNSALWYLYLQQEFVYVGDAGIIEPSGKTKRIEDCVINWMIICILMRTQTTLTREALMNLWAKLHSSCTRFYINWRIKFSKNGMDFQGITIPLFKVVLQMKIIL